MTHDTHTPPVLTAIDGGDAAETYRLRPHNIDAEQAVLGAILVNNEAASRVSELLLDEHFYEPAHQRIYDAAIRLIERNQLANPITLKHYFEQDQTLSEVNGPEYLARLAGAAVTIYNVDHYAQVVHDLALRRTLIDIGEEMTHDAADSDIDDSANDQIERSEQRLFQLAETGQKENGFQSFNTTLAEAIRMADAAYKRDSQMVGLATGLTDLDHKLGGLHPSDLLVLASRPAMGKTALATNIAFAAAKAYRPAPEGAGGEPEDGAVVGYFSLEMSAEQLGVSRGSVAIRT